MDLHNNSFFPNSPGNLPSVPKWVNSSQKFFSCLSHFMKKRKEATDFTVMGLNGNVSSLKMNIFDSFCQCNMTLTTLTISLSLVFQFTSYLPLSQPVPDFLTHSLADVALSRLTMSFILRKLVICLHFSRAVSYFWLGPSLQYFPSNWHDVLISLPLSPFAFFLDFSTWHLNVEVCMP